MLAARQGVARGAIAARRAAVGKASSSDLPSSSSKRPQASVLRAPAGFVIVSRAKSTVATSTNSTNEEGGAGAERKPIDGTALRKGSAKTAAVKSSPVGKAPASSVAATAASATRSRKLTPTAKAKAQASASRALREQLSAVRGAGGAISATPQLVQQEIEEVLAARAQRVAATDGDDAREGSGGGLGRGGSSEQEQQLRMLTSALELSHTLVDPLTPAEAAAATSSSGIASKQASSSFQYQHRLRDVVAYATAEGYDFEALIGSGRLPDGWQLLEDDEVLYIPSWPRSQAGKAPSSSSSSSSSTASSQQSLHHAQVPWVGGDAFLFRSGSYVTWGMTEEQSRRFLRAVIRTRASASGATQRAMSLAAAVGKGRRNSNSSSIRGPSEIEIGPYDEIGDEAMEYLVAEDQVTRVVGDVIVMGQAPTLDPKEDFTSGNDDVGAGDSASNNVGNATDSVNEEHLAGGQEDEPPSWTPLLARLAFSQGLARSARLSVQESALSSYLEEVASVPGRLEAAGKVPMHRREVIRKMGTLLRLRQRANLDTENFLDDPEIYWENSKVEHHYDSICATLDIESRFKAYNEKLDHGENLLGVLRALLTESSTHRMELIIIYLIAFEVCLALISHEYIPSPGSVWTTLKDVLGIEDAPPVQIDQSPTNDPLTKLQQEVPPLLLPGTSKVEPQVRLV